MTDEALPKSAGMRSLQILQTVMLALLLGGVGLVVNIVLADHRLLAGMEENQKLITAEMSALRADLEKLRDGEWNLDRRVTTMEAKVK